MRVSVANRNKSHEHSVGALGRKRWEAYRSKTEEDASAIAEQLGEFDLIMERHIPVMLRRI